MRDNHDSKYRWLIFLGITLAIMIVIGALTYLASTVSLLPIRTPALHTALPVSPLPTLENTPIVRFAQLDSAIVNVIDNSASNYGDFDSLGARSIESVGMYLPRSGDTQFTIAQPTALPTPLPFPTSPPLPLPALAELPTLAPSDERVLAYQGDDCAPSNLPVEGILTQRFHRYHSGIDLGVPSNTPVIATHSGQVIFADWSDIGYGYLVIIQNQRFITYYAHNTSFNVASGDQVGQGSIIAWSGSTGNSTGPHVHYETRINDVPVDPLTFEGRGYPNC